MDDSRETRQAAFDWWVAHNCCEIREVAEEFGMPFSVINKWRRQDDWDKRFAQIFRERIIDNKAAENGTFSQTISSQITKVRYIQAQYLRHIRHLDEQRRQNLITINDHLVALGQVQEALLPLIALEKGLARELETFNQEVKVYGNDYYEALVQRTTEQLNAAEEGLPPEPELPPA